MSRFFVDPDCISGSHIYIEDKDDLHHLIRVLRARIGMKLDISDKNQWEYIAEIEELSGESAVLRILDKQKFATEPMLRVTLYQGIPKGSKMETVIQKTVEMGVNSVVPVFMERTVIAEKGNSQKKLVRWQKISDEAVKQCKRGIIPEVCPSHSFAEMVSELGEYDLVLCPYENEEGRTIKAFLRSLENAEDVKSAAIIIGPEGGFSEREISVLEDAGAVTVTLGKTILRTETAGMAALAMIMYELEL